MTSARLFTLSCLLLAALSPLARAQTSRIDFPAASPAAELRQRVGLTDFQIVYSRPSVKDRQIFGELQAYGEVWRTGANAATKITFDTPIVFGGKPVAAGTYGLFSIPGETEWTVILNRTAEQWGAFNYDEAEDVLRVTVPVQALADPVESFSIWFNDLRDESATLNLTWEKVSVAVPIKVDVKDRIVPQIEAVMGAGQQQRDYIYFQSAGFYFDHNLDLQKAAKWIDLALAQSPNAFWMLHLKAKIHAKLGNKSTAITAAESSTKYAVAQEGPGSGYKVMNDALIAELR
ncbi:DUF2911 domain-containing protein [Synoicihabitans lomoniglobus]|uniref:DUF2911 domain-containing protein n=1 Tax=Synoicihabitans lomoniglobus TaxID=2909285 RepID=A0AAF0CR40_9BACT|nr:DUF2911 domain-containing protein [Opitutaceae bacterium LMO-M01]WED66520.1 DUF2911 domain-containing protein [Opitutaceae bacterium LMO-M01]